MLKETPIAFKVLFDNLIEGGLLIDLATSEIKRCNRAFSALLGCGADVIQSGNHLSLLPEKQSDGTNSSSVLKALAQGALTSEMVTMEIEYLHSNGRILDLEANRSKLFRMFKRFHDHLPGRGIGLYMVKSIVESYGGTIDVASVVDEGTEFTIRIPHQ